MNTENNFTKLIGNTPLIKLEKASKITKCNILGKAEFLNPGQSVKDRAALYIIKDAIKKKKLKKNGSWIKIKNDSDNYKGFIKKKLFSTKQKNTHKVYNLSAKLYSKPNTIIKKKLR